MGIGDITDGIARRIEHAADEVTGIFQPVIRLGVTGLARAGKTVFITSLVANLRERGRMPQLLAEAEGRILTAYLQPQPDDTIPRFDYENHLAALKAPEPHWPESTRSISQLRLSLKVQAKGLMAAMSGPRVIHLDIIDYPGEWLLDLTLIGKSYGEWSDQVIERASVANRASLSKSWLARLEDNDPAGEYYEAEAQELARNYTGYLNAAREAGLSGMTPGRFLMPGELEGSPVLTFCPLLRPDRKHRQTLYAEFERRFEAYKSRIAKPFFRNHFARIDRQIVLVDVLGAITAGPAALADLQDTMAEILTAFRPGKNHWLSALIGRRVEKVLFAATKADHLHHSQHPKLTDTTAALLREAKERAEFKGAGVGAISLAALRSTTEDRITHEGERLDCVHGVLEGGETPRAVFTGDLPDDPARLLLAAQSSRDWPKPRFIAQRFAPPVLVGKGFGLPHIRLDKAMEFLIGDRI